VNTVSQLQGHWEREYESTSTPFEIEEPDPWITALARNGKIHGNVLDAGCGLGRNSFYLAGLGHRVLGVDISVNAIERAQRKAAQKRCSARFLHADVCDLFGFDGHFETVIDIGCFHSLDVSARGPYAAALHLACRRQAVVYLRALSTSNSAELKHPSGKSLPALSQTHIRDAFSSNGWAVKDLVEREIEIFVSKKEAKQKAYCWFAEMQCA
jgi:cyclopropane fatty-acyl-phospholipid synthase-like methyltransferase